MRRAGKAGFVPRPGPTRVGSARLGWETSLGGWTRLGWTYRFAGWTPLGGSTRAALLRVATRAVRRAGRVTLRTHPGETQTGRPVGTRMGKGKGKPRGHLRWFPRGAPLVDLRGPRPPGWGVLPGRTPGGGGRVLRSFW